MDEHTPIDVPIRLEEWDRHDCINEVDTIVVDIRLILDATDYGHLPAPDDWTADFIAEEAQRLGLLRLWNCPNAGSTPPTLNGAGPTRSSKAPGSGSAPWRGTRSCPASKGPKPSSTGS